MSVVAPFQIIEACAEIAQARLFRKQLRNHCEEAMKKMADHEMSANSQVELDVILYNHSMVLLKQITYQPKDQVEVFVPTTPQDIFAAMDKDGDGEVNRDEFSEAIRLEMKTVSDEEIDRMFKQLDTDGGGTLTVDDGQIQAGGETTHSGTWGRATVMDVGATHITVEMHSDKSALAVPQRSLSDLGSPQSEPSAPPPPRRLQVPWVQPQDDMEDPAELMLTRIRPVSEEALAEEKQVENARAAVMRAKREKEAQEAAARGESLTRMAKAMWANKGKGERKNLQEKDNSWDKGTNIDAFIQQHDIRILGPGPGGDRVKEKTREAAEKLVGRSITDAQPRHFSYK